MKPYISKAALVAEIERLKESFVNERDGFEKGYHHGLDMVLSLLDGIEIKEVELEKEIENWVKTGPHTSYPWCTIPDAIRITAEHFYELGQNENFR